MAIISVTSEARIGKRDLEACTSGASLYRWFRGQGSSMRPVHRAE
jgi:hypothetical protein